MNKSLVLFIQILLSLAVQAQTRVVKNEDGNMVTEVNYNRLPVLRYKGSIFLKDSVEMATFTVAGGEIYQKSALYDVFNQSFLADFGVKKVTLRNVDVQLGNRLFKNINQKYYETCYDSKIKVLVHYSCALKDFRRGGEDKSFPKLDNDYIGEVSHKKDYFLLFPDNRLLAVNLSNYSVSLALAKEIDGLDYYIRKWNRKITTAQDLIDLLRYLESESVI